MSISQAGFDWWQWMMLGVGCWFAAWVLVMLTRREQGGGFSSIIGWVGGLAGAFCAGVGILQLIRWVLDRPNQ